MCIQNGIENSLLVYMKPIFFPISYTTNIKISKSTKLELLIFYVTHYGTTAVVFI